MPGQRARSCVGGLGVGGGFGDGWGVWGWRFGAEAKGFGFGRGPRSLPGQRGRSCRGKVVGPRLLMGGAPFGPFGKGEKLLGLAGAVLPTLPARPRLPAASDLPTPHPPPTVCGRPTLPALPRPAPPAATPRWGPSALGEGAGCRGFGGCKYGRVELDLGAGARQALRGKREQPSFSSQQARLLIHPPT